MDAKQDEPTQWVVLLGHEQFNNSLQMIAIGPFETKKKARKWVKGRELNKPDLRLYIKLEKPDP